MLEFLNSCWACWFFVGVAAVGTSMYLSYNQRSSKTTTKILYQQPSPVQPEKTGVLDDGNVVTRRKVAPKKLKDEAESTCTYRSTVSSHQPVDVVCDCGLVISKITVETTKKDVIEPAVVSDDDTTEDIESENLPRTDCKEPKDVEEEDASEAADTSTQIVQDQDDAKTNSEEEEVVSVTEPKLEEAKSVEEVKSAVVEPAEATEPEEELSFEESTPEEAGTMHEVETKPTEESMPEEVEPNEEATREDAEMVDDAIPTDTEPTAEQIPEKAESAEEAKFEEAEATQEMPFEETEAMEQPETNATEETEPEHEEEVAALPTQDDKARIIEIMMDDLPSEVEEKVEKGLSDLADLCISEEYRDKVHQMGGPLTIIRKLKKYRSNVGIQRQACRALKVLSMNKEAQKIGVELGGVENTVASMNEHMSDELVQEYGIAALGNLVHENQGHADILVACGGLETIATAMQTHVDSNELQSRGCYAFANICHFVEHVPDVQKAGGFSVVATAVETYGDSADIQENGRKVLKPWVLA